MWKKPRSCKPQDMIYPDRCMLKWQGMLLSDHNERMRLEQVLEIYETKAIYHTEAEYEMWDRLILRSKREGMPITLRIRPLNEPPVSVTGVVQSIKPTKLALLTEQGSLNISRHEVDDVFG